MNSSETLPGREDRGMNGGGGRRDVWCGGGSMTRAVFTILAAALFCSFTQASPIGYSLTTSASGTLGGTSFTNALVTVTLTGDTADVTAGPVPFTRSEERRVRK